jgi:hypothetical protein
VVSVLSPYQWFVSSKNVHLNVALATWWLSWVFAQLQIAMSEHFEAAVDTATVSPPSVGAVYMHGDTKVRVSERSRVALQKVLREALVSAVPPAEATAAAVAKIFPGAATASQVSMHAYLQCQSSSRR